MDWSKAKTIFIITFMLLNAFLFIQLNAIKSAHQINTIYEVPFQERLNDMNIVVDVEMEEEQLEGYYIVGKDISIHPNIVEQLTKQEALLVNETTIYSVLDEPFELKGEDWLTPLNQFVMETVYQGELYHFAGINEATDEIVYLQKYDGKVMYSFDEAPLVLKLEENNKVIAYQQSIIEVNEQGREQEFLSGFKAIEKLLNEQIIRANNTITRVELGYYSFFRPLGDVQVFAPMWRVTVEGESYLVNAIDGSLQDFN